MAVSTITLSDRLRNLPQYLLPQGFITRGAFFLTRIRVPWFKNRFIRIFANHFDVDMGEALQTDISSYEHFNAFFTRQLKPGSRPIADGEHLLCCPVDGAVSQVGDIVDDTIFQAKGQSYSLTRLLGNNQYRARQFRGGSFVVSRLLERLEDCISFDVFELAAER